MKNWFIYLLTIIVIVVTLQQCREDYKVKKEIDKLQRVNDSINDKIKEDVKKIDSLDQVIVKQTKTNDSLTLLKQQVRVERQIVFQEVEQLTEDALDSIIKSKPKRYVVKTILDYPLLVQELTFADSLIANLKANVKTLDLKTGFQDNIISQKDMIISNITKQRDIYKQASQPKSGLFLYASVPISNFNSPEIGALYQFKNTVILGFGAQYNNFTKAPELKATIGIKIL